MVDFIPVCPEVELGLGVPRDPIRVVRREGEDRLVQPGTHLDLTREAKEFAEGFLDSLPEVEGFLLKSGSPSCGLEDVKVYPKEERSALVDKGAGFFGSQVLKRFGDRAVEDESRLRNFKIAEHFLSKLYALADLRDSVAEGDLRSMYDFHSRHKLQLMAYNQSQMREMGRLLARGKERGIEEVTSEYRERLSRAMARGPRCSSSINVMKHAMGHFSDRLNAEEKAYFLDSLNDYKEGRVPLSVNIAVMRSWIVRFGDDFLRSQTFFRPFPPDLLDVEITDSCLTRDYWD